MIEVENSVINSKSVTTALQKLFDSDGFEGKTAARIGRLANEAAMAQARFQKEMADIIKGACKLDKEGVPITDKQGNFKWKSKKQEGEYKRKFQLLLKQKQKFKLHKIDVTEIPKGVISANELLLLDFFVDGLKN